jgi:hypothetical protein
MDFLKQQAQQQQQQNDKSSRQSPAQIDSGKSSPNQSSSSQHQPSSPLLNERANKIMLHHHQHHSMDPQTMLKQYSLQTLLNHQQVNPTLSGNIYNNSNPNNNSQVESNQAGLTDFTLHGTQQPQISFHPHQMQQSSSFGQHQQQPYQIQMQSGHFGRNDQSSDDENEGGGVGGEYANLSNYRPIMASGNGGGVMSLSHLNAPSHHHPHLGHPHLSHLNHLGGNSGSGHPHHHLSGHLSSGHHLGSASDQVISMQYLQHPHQQHEENEYINSNIGQSMCFFRFKTFLIFFLNISFFTNSV